MALAWYVERLRAMLAATALAMAGAEARAARFDVKPAPSLPDRTVIVMIGAVTEGDAGRFRDALQDARRLKPGLPPLLVLDSRGGHLEEALAIAAEVRRNGLPTSVMPGSPCWSACAFIFFGGFDARTQKPDRTAYGSAGIGVHRWRRVVTKPGTVIPPGAAEADDQRTTRRVERFHAEMRLSPEISRRSLETETDRVYILTEADMSGSEIAVRPAAEAPLQLAIAPGGPPCGPDCSSPVRTVSRTADRGLSRAEPRLVTGAEFLASWTKLLMGPVRISSCTLWLPGGGQTPCVVEEGGRRLGFILIDDASFHRAGVEWVPTRCSTAEPNADCRVELRGSVALGPGGPVLFGTRAKPLAVSPAAAP